MANKPVSWNVHNCLLSRHLENLPSDVAHSHATLGRHFLHGIVIVVAVIAKRRRDRHLLLRLRGLAGRQFHLDGLREAQRMRLECYPFFLNSLSLTKTLFIVGGAIPLPLRDPIANPRDGAGAADCG